MNGGPAVSAQIEPTENQNWFTTIVNTIVKAISSRFFTGVEQPSAQNVPDVIKAWITKEKRANDPILCKAASQGRLDVMRWILQNGHTEMVRLLLKLPKGQRPDVNARDYQGMTPLLCAAIFDCTEIARFLLELPEDQRPDVEVRDDKDRTALFWTTVHDRIEIVRLFLNLPEGQRPDLNASDNEGWTLLHVAAYFGRTEIIRLLLDLLEGQRPDVDLIDNEEKTPIALAFEQGHHATVALLQRHGAQLPAHLRPDAPPGVAAAAAINDGQSIHTTSNHESVSNSATGLLACYATENIAAARESLFAWVRR